MAGIPYSIPVSSNSVQQLAGVLAQRRSRSVKLPDENFENWYSAYRDGKLPGPFPRTGFSLMSFHATWFIYNLMSADSLFPKYAAVPRIMPADTIINAIFLLLRCNSHVTRQIASASIDARLCVRGSMMNPVSAAMKQSGPVYRTACRYSASWARSGSDTHRKHPSRPGFVNEPDCGRQNDEPADCFSTMKACHMVVIASDAESQFRIRSVPGPENNIIKEIQHMADSVVQ